MSWFDIYTQDIENRTMKQLQIQIEIMDRKDKEIARLELLHETNMVMKQYRRERKMKGFFESAAKRA